MNAFSRKKKICIDLIVLLEFEYIFVPNVMKLKFYAFETSVSLK